MSRMSLRELYYDPRQGLGSLVKFAAVAKKHGFSTKEVLAFLAAQEVHQVHRERSKVNYFPNWGQGTGSYQIDLMFQEGTPILTIINVTTRYVYAFVLKRKTADEVLAALEKWIKTVRDTPTFVQSDGGTEFLNRGVNHFFEKNHIERRIADPGDHHGQGEIERFHGTLRRLFRLYEDAFKEPWKKGFDDLVYNYNHRIHRSIGVEPVNASDVQGMYARQQQYQKAMVLESTFHIGDQVRKSVNRSTLFDKGKVRWSERVYTITGKTGHRFELDDGSQVLCYDLQRVTSVEKHTLAPSLEPIRAATKAVKRVTRNLTKEGIQGGNVVESTRKSKAPELFEAAPAPDPRTLVRPVVVVKNPRGSRAPNPDDIKYVQTRSRGKFIYGKVVNGVARYSDGSAVTYTPEELVAHRFPITKADKANFNKVVKSLG